MSSNTIKNICQRVRSVTRSTTTDSDCLQISIASSMRDAEAVIGLMVSHHMSKLILKNQDTLKITHTEWQQLFEMSISPIQDNGMASFVDTPSFKSHAAKIEDALRLTFQEDEQSRLWKKPWHKLVVYISMHLDFADDALLKSVGTIIKADQRKIEDYMNNIDDNGVETMTFVKSLQFVCNTCTRL